MLVFRGVVRPLRFGSWEFRWLCWNKSSRIVGGPKWFFVQLKIASLDFFKLKILGKKARNIFSWPGKTGAYPHVRYPHDTYSLNKESVIKHSCSLNKALLRLLFLMGVLHMGVSKTFFQELSSPTWCPLGAGNRGNKETCWRNEFRFQS